jgi:hypothetical protein
MRRLSVVLLAALALFLGVAGSASAAPVTTHQKGQVETFVSVINGCDESGPLFTITTTSNQVEKETVKDDGTFHGTTTLTAKVVAVPLDPNLPTYTGSHAGSSMRALLSATSVVETKLTRRA